MKNKKLYPLYLCALALAANSARAQTAPAPATTTTTTTTTTATPAAAAAPAAPAAAPTSPVSTPSMEGPLAVNLKPESFDVPDFGKIYVSGVVSAIGFADWPRFPGEKSAVADISNAQIFVQKVDGAFQFFLDAGTYSFPTVGVPYTTTGNTISATYGALPEAFVKYAPNAAFSIEAGKLPGLIGAEYLFTYENMNISRGLLWNQEPGVSRGVQANYTAGPVTINASWNDGFYSNRYNWGTAAVTWTINSANTLELVGGGNFGTTDYGTSATPEVINNDKELLNLIYSYTNGAWLAQVYGQYAKTGNSAAIGIGKDTSTSGVGVLVNYAVPNTSWNLSARFEDISSSGSFTDGSANLLYGPGSKAWSLTFTPTYQVGAFFTRGEVSLVGASSSAPGFEFGKSGTSSSTVRFAIETGILF
jgi:Putative beta-barrel porin-2, OmpL-like. bbp2